MAMHFDMYFFHKTSLYGAILVLRTATNEGGVGYIIIISANQRYEGLWCQRYSHYKGWEQSTFQKKSVA